MIVREAEIEDLERAMQVLDAGRQHMRGEGNAAQWINGYPSPELIRRDIEQGQFFVWIDEAEEQTDRQQAIHGAFSFIIGEDPTYAHIENGSWLNEKPGVQHLLHLKSKSKILRPIEIMGFFYEIFCQIQENNLL